MKRDTGYWLLTMALLLGMVLSACAAPSKPAPAPAPERQATGTPAAPATQLTDEQRLIEGAKKEGEVNMWVVTWGPQRREVEQLFEAKYPFIKIKRWDGVLNEGIIARFIEESKAGVNAADMFYLSKNLSDARAAGLLAEYDYPTKGWPQQPNHKSWMNLVVGGHVAIYNRELVSPAEAPKTYDDMKNPKWRGKTMLSNSASDAPFRYAYMWREGDKLNWEKAESYWTEVVSNTKPRSMAGMTTLIQLLAAGEIPLLPNLAVGPFFNFYFKGAPVALVPLGQMPGNAFSIAIAKNAPHPNAARLWANFLATPEAQIIISETQGNPPLSPEVSGKSRLKQLLTQMGAEPLTIPDEFWTVENIGRSQKFWATLLGIRG
ncbi:MAG: ABC transporter substrate-binding protein [Dehalococcoidia bacterium]|nr:ABC transporter substrate-binding protein [Dehalococcoidia bacterium]